MNKGSKPKSRKSGRSSSGNGSERVLHVMVETPGGCKNKYKFDQKTSRLILSKVLPEGMIFPYDFGFLPGTRAPDGDPLDVLILTDEPTFPGCELDVRLLGVIKATQKENGKATRNDRLVAVAEQSIRYAEVKDLADLDPGLLR
jgi:inorganic pyrophosphatase